MRTFAAPTNSAPTFGGVRASPGQRYAVEWVKRRLRAIHREARGAGRDSPLNEPAAHLYLLIATYVLDRRFISEPARLQDLAGIMHCESITVTRARKRLTGLGEVGLIAGGQGKSDVRFALLKMAGPLYVEQGGAAPTSGAATSIPQSEVTSIPQSEVAAPTSICGIDVGRQLPSQSRKLAGASSLDLEAEDSGSSSTKSIADAAVAELRERVDNPDAETIAEAVRIAEAIAEENVRIRVLEPRVEYFLDWWTKNYPVHNSGVQNPIRVCDREAAFSLLSGGTLQRCQAMAIELWSLRGTYSRSDWTFIVGSDRSVRVLLQKATIIEREVVGLGLDEPSSLAAGEGLPSKVTQRVTLGDEQHHAAGEQKHDARERHEEQAWAAIDAMSAADRNALRAAAAAELATRAELPGMKHAERERILRRFMVGLILDGTFKHERAG